MAHTYYYSNVKALVADGHRARLQGIRSILHYLGFRDVEWCDTLADMRGRGDRFKPDLIISANDMPDGPAGGFFQEVRRGRTDLDPFTPIVAVLSEASPDAVRRGVDSGADDLLIHPWPTGYLDSRLEKLIHNRKPFVVSADYVGPDRRAKARSGPQAPIIVPPNLLEAKALKRLSHEAVEPHLAKARSTLSQHRLHALAGLCVRLIDELRGLHARGQWNDPLVGTQLARISAAADEATTLTAQGPASSTLATFLDLSRHALLSKDAQQCNRVASLQDLTKLGDSLAATFKIETSLLLDRPAPAGARPTMTGRIAQPRAAAG